MPTIFSQGWGTAAQSYTIDLYPSSTPLAHDSARTGAALDIKGLGNVQDILIFIGVKPNGTVGSDQLCNWFAAGCVDGGTLYTGGCAVNTTYTTFATASDTNTPVYANVMFGRPIACQRSSIQEYGGPFSLALLFGGVLPEKVILGVHNRTNVNLSSNNTTENFVKYQVVYTQA